VARGETVFRQGEPGEHLFLIASGSMRLSTGASEGFEQPIALL
jgi:CRP-like cAMP-binding protein